MLSKRVKILSLELAATPQYSCRREGEVAFIALSMLNAGLASRIARHGEVDPFTDDSLLPQFYEFIDSYHKVY
jgi:hypothetical protein